MDFSTYLIPVVVGVCYIVGEIVKKWVKDVDNKYIPTINSILGVVLAIWLNKWSITPEIIFTGLASGWASTGGYEMIKNLFVKQ